MKYLEYKNHEIPKLECCVLNRRLTAIGGQNGWLGVFLVDSTKNGFEAIYFSCNSITFFLIFLIFVFKKSF